MKMKCVPDIELEKDFKHRSAWDYNNMKEEMEMCSGEDRRHKTPVQPSLSHYHYIPFPSIKYQSIIRKQLEEEKHFGK